MGALTRVAVPRLLTGDASGLDGCQLRGLASAMAFLATSLEDWQHVFVKRHFLRGGRYRQRE